MIEINCISCGEPLVISDIEMSCSNKHTFRRINEVYQLLNTGEKTALDKFLLPFETYRNEKKQLINIQNINKLPFVNFDKSLWRLRQLDLNLILKKIEQKPNSILEIGAWNGWLSNQLSKNNHNVTAIDYFTKPFDGLESIQYQDNKYLAIQMFPKNISNINTKFDIIILNRCLPYFDDLNMLITDMKKLLSENGKIIITGVNETKKIEQAKTALLKKHTIFEKKYNHKLGINNFKGFIDKEDIKLLKQHQFQIKRYKSLILKSFMSKLGLTKIDYKYAIFMNN
jgi:2-polyprenyl-3-methyl-5-hydroxy-6-metoxy-1,4-benzoquinol methylase